MESDVSWLTTAAIVTNRFDDNAGDCKILVSMQPSLSLDKMSHDGQAESTSHRIRTQGQRRAEVVLSTMEERVAERHLHVELSSPSA